MTKHFVSSAVVGTLLLAAGLASAQPAYCPTTPPSACGQASIGDLLVTLHGPPRIVGLNPSTRIYYMFSSALVDLQSTELGDIAVVPNNPVETVVIGNVDPNRRIGVQRLDACGMLASPQYGTFPAQWPLPWNFVLQVGTNNRGLVFNPLHAQLYSPGLISHFAYDPYQTQRGSVFQFPEGGGASTILAAEGNELVDPTITGSVAADEYGNLFLGDSFGASLAKVAAKSLVDGAPEESWLGSFPLNKVHDLVHDGNNHLFVTDYDGDNQGKVYRTNLYNGISQVWTPDLGPAFGHSPFNELYGITIDAGGDLWVVEQYSPSTNRAGLVRISGRTGQVLDYFQMPPDIDGDPVAGAQPFGIAVYGVNLPAVRERCAGTCSEWEVSDCYGGCLPVDYVGDDICDAGPTASFNCYARGFDDNDCNPCPPDEVPDCNGHCALENWVGDGICDDGGWLWNGEYIDYDCAAFRFDEATCRTCNADETLDCHGHCAPLSWLGDGICDEGTYTYLGEVIDFDCAEYDFDQHTCQ